MAKNKNYYYVLVFTSEGPKYVTGLGEHNTAYWDALKDPEPFAKYEAEEIVYGLRCNWHPAVLVTTPVELSGQPYNYDEFEIEWKRKENSND